MTCADPTGRGWECGGEARLSHLVLALPYPSGKYYSHFTGWETEAQRERRPSVQVMGLLEARAKV